MKKDYLIIIPVFNERDVLREVTLATIQESISYADILFVNDGSTDGSTEELLKLAQEFPFLKMIHKKSNEGYGASLISGFNYGIYFGYKYWITMDCDNQHQPSDLIRFKEFDPDVDLVSGSRYLSDSLVKGISAPKDRVEINRRITCLLNSRYSLQLTDSFCGFKRYKASAFKDHNFTISGYASPLELWAYVNARSLVVQEIAVDKIYITGDRSFGDDLDKKRKRYKFYLKTWYESHKKYTGSMIQKTPCTV